MLDWQKGVVTRLKENTQVNWNDIAHAVEENPESLRKISYKITQPEFQISLKEQFFSPNQNFKYL